MHDFINITEYKQFWSLNDSQKCMFYSNTIDKNEKQRTRTNNENSSWKFSFQYFFIISNKKIRVCKEFYLSYQPKTSSVVFFDKKKSIFYDKRGRHAKSKISNDAKKFIRDHINSFQRMPSHYCRTKTKREYLNPNIFISRMFELYKEECVKLNLDPQKYYL